MSRRDKWSPYALGIQLYTKYTRNQILNMSEVQNYKEIRPNLYGVENKLIVGFVDIQQFEQVNLNHIATFSLDWIEKPAFARFQNNNIRIRVDYLRSFHLFAKHHTSQSYIFIGWVSKVEAVFSSPTSMDMFGLSEESQTTSTLYLSQRLAIPILIELKGSEWSVEINREILMLSSDDLTAEIHRRVANQENNLLKMTLTRYDGLRLDATFYDYRCSINVSKDDKYLGSVIDQSILDDRARLMVFDEGEIAFELRKTIDTEKAFSVIEYFINTGQQADWVTWQK